MLASLLLEQVWRGYNQAPEKYSAMNIEIGISRNTKCAIWNGFTKSSHILLHKIVPTLKKYLRMCSISTAQCEQVCFSGGHFANPVMSRLRDCRL